MKTFPKNYLIGQRARVENEKEIAVITRIDFERGFIYLLFKRMREEKYPFPQALEQNLIKPIISKTHKKY
ncbi:hypothetical protein [Candidatus Phytoplasma solani]|uniref:Uncharacterized protein n=1 Tax=Candidatus Phytoplasma solani TaxID=69896 RepID=A0A421NYT9_9MOLU|nr:hypothetical protein [Candidatus Phytoplasma solani]RMI89132.1 hypothetical protein PSSA1_v1c0110 [Candidatus Phytoplasma solani]CCP88373.1 conserved hypothetical protein [Candidatus Phytoplasma solani]